jgi:hypothetical protein
VPVVLLISCGILVEGDTDRARSSGMSFPSPALCSSSSAAPLLVVPEERVPLRSTSSPAGMDMSSPRGSSSDSDTDSDSDSGVGGFLVVALRFDALVLDEPGSIATGRGGDGAAGAAALALAPLFGLAGPGAVERVPLCKGPPSLVWQGQVRWSAYFCARGCSLAMVAFQLLAEPQDVGRGLPWSCPQQKVSARLPGHLCSGVGT